MRVSDLRRPQGVLSAALVWAVPAAAAESTSTVYRIARLIERSGGGALNE